MDLRENLKELGLSIPVAAKPVAAYLPATRTGNLIFTAGQLPMLEGSLVREGKVGQEVTVEEAKDLARLCALNCLAAVETLLPIEKITRIVRVVGYVNGVSGFVSQPAVMNGASELFVALWGESGKHARSAIGVADLPLNAPIEVELTVEVAD
jgi:enamine deaminase RidA (YjgF/YER057c/UK114 family)